MKLITQEKNKIKTIEVLSLKEAVEINKKNMNLISSSEIKNKRVGYIFEENTEESRKPDYILSYNSRIWIKNPYKKKIKENDLINFYQKKINEYENKKNSRLLSTKENKQNIENYKKIYIDLTILGMTIVNDNIKINENIPINEQGISIYEESICDNNFLEIENKNLKYFYDENNKMNDLYKFEKYKENKERDIILNKYYNIINKISKNQKVTISDFYIGDVILKEILFNFNDFIEKRYIKINKEKKDIFNIFNNILEKDKDLSDDERYKFGVIFNNILFNKKKIEKRIINNSNKI